MGLFSFAGSLIGGGSLKKGLTKAANAQANSSNAQIAANDTSLSQITSNYSPYTSLGSSAAQAFADLLGLGGSSGTTTTGANDWDAYLQRNPDVAAEYASSVDKKQFPTPESYAQWHYANYGQGEGRANGLTTTGPAVSASDAQANAIASLKESPLYQSLYSTGEEALLANASATGGLRGGNTQTGLADFGRDTLASVIQQQLANYGTGISAGLTGTGATTAANLATTAASNSATQASTDALIQKILGKAGINSQNWSNAGGILDSAAGSLLSGKSLGSTLKGLF